MARQYDEDDADRSAEDGGDPDYPSTPDVRYWRLIQVASALEAAVRDLDELQVTDYKHVGKVAPIKGRLRDLLAEPVRQLRDLAQTEYQEAHQPPKS